MSKSDKNPACLQLLLDTIAKAVGTDSNYNAYYGNEHSEEDLSAYTLGYIINVQLDLRAGSRDGYGRYMLPWTSTRGLSNYPHISREEYFTPELQDRLATIILIGLGLEEWRANPMTDEANESFIDRLSSEWPPIREYPGIKEIIAHAHSLKLQPI